MKVFVLQFLGFLLLNWLLHCHAYAHYTFVVEETPYTRLCSTKNILTVNGSFPGPTLYANRGETFFVHVYNKGNQNITIHWHGVKQQNNPWTDGPDYITQCPIQPGGNFSQKVILSTEEGTLWWHAHSDWLRATVHGAIVVYPDNGSTYPFPKPYGEFPIILGEWWKEEIEEVFYQFELTGGNPALSDAYTINGQPGDLYPCSSSGTTKIMVDHNQTYMLRMINACMNDIKFVGITNHSLTVVGTDGSYTKPFSTNYITISPGQTMDVLLKANQWPGQYYIASTPYSSATGVAFDNTTATAILQYSGGNYTTPPSPSPSPSPLPSPSPSPSPQLPSLPYFNDTNASVNFTSRLRSLADADHPISVPLIVTTNMLIVISVNTLPCANNSCQGPGGSRLAASMNNISFVNPPIDLLQAYYNNDSAVYGVGFPNDPPDVYNYTADNPPMDLWPTATGTQVKVLNYDTTMEIVFQGTNLLAGEDHPIHLHGYSFYAVGWGFGNFDEEKDPLGYNLVDPPLQNTITVPKNGWAAIRFTADNPGVWFMHCHLERHLSWGMDVAFIVQNGPDNQTQLLPPPPDMPPC